MIVLGSSTAESGMEAAIATLKAGGRAVDAVETGLRSVETAPDVHSVGQDAWPNLLGQHQLDASIMEGETRNAGAVGGLSGFIHPISVARQVMEQLPHVFLVGEGAARFADEIGAERGDLMTQEVRDGWASWIQEKATPQEWQNWPPDKLVPWAQLTADPETAHGTVTLMARDQYGHIASGVSTSGWGWKYPGRVGDSSIIGAGNYADDRWGAASCTGFGEMTIRANTARSVLFYVKTGSSIAEAVGEAVGDLHAVDWGYRGVVTIYAFSQDEQYNVVTYARSTDARSTYRLWQDGMSGPELREGKVISSEKFPGKTQ